MPYSALNICGYEDSLFSSVIMDYREKSYFKFVKVSSLFTQCLPSGIFN